MIKKIINPSFLQRALIILSIIFLGACSAAKKSAVTFPESILSEASIFNQNFTGFALFDPEKREYVYQQNAEKYFIPASTIKLFTFYAGLKILSDSVPGLYYTEKNDSLIFWGSGDPSFLHPKFQNNKIFSFLKNTDKVLCFSPSNYADKHFGPGWAWDDYFYTYSSEKAPFPIYGNFLEIKLSGNPKLHKPLLNYGFNLEQVNEKSKGTSVIQREPGNNKISYFAASDTVQRIVTLPFRYSPELFVQLLSDTLKTKVSIVKENLPENKRELYGIATDSLYKEMLQESDNFVAEQILLLCSGKTSEELNSKEAIKHISREYFGTLSDSIRWVDGSGLSRYNLATPRSIVELLNILYHEVERERLFQLLPAGGKSGTIKDSFTVEKPYVFAKTGSFSNNYNISGYLITSSGKTLIFSFMNNNFLVPVEQIRKEITKVLDEVHRQL